MDNALHTVAFTSGFLVQTKSEGVTEAELAALVQTPFGEPRGR